MRLVICGLIATVLYFLSAGLGGFWPAAWLAPIALLWLAYRGEARGALFLASFGAYAIGQTNLLEAYAQLIPVPYLLALIALGSLGFASCVLFARFAARRLPALVAVFAFPALATTIEFVTALISPNGTFGSFAYSQVGEPLLIQTASLVGLWGITFLLGLFASLLALAIARGFTLFGVIACVLAVLVFAGNVFYGGYVMRPRTGTIVTSSANAPAERVERVGLAVDDRLYAESRADDAASALKVTTAYADAARALAAKGATTIVLPEKIAIVRPAWREAAIAPLAEVSRQTGARITVGFEERGGEPHNIALTLMPDGSVATYLKRHMVPGVELLAPGREPGLLGNRMAVVICKDMDFQRTIRADAQNAIGLLLVPAWDFGADGWAHARMAILRGVENAFAIARAPRQGVLTITDAFGRILTRAPSDRHGLVTLVADVPFGPGNTLYNRIGDVFGWVALGLFLLFALAAIAAGRRARA
jgi:apolipoprotein N-acyltransferase